MFGCHKYIIVETMGHKVAIMFDLLLEHATVAGNLKVESAGFYDVCSERQIVSTFGKSESLKIESNKEDGKLIEKILFPTDEYI